MSEKPETPLPASTLPQNPGSPTVAKVAVVTLANPIVRGGEAPPIDKLTLKKPNAGNLRGLSLTALMQSDVNAVVAVLPRIADPFITEQEAWALEADDLAEIGGAIIGFFLTPAQKAQIQQVAGG